MAVNISEAVIKLELENKELKAKLGESLTAVDNFKSKVQSASAFLQKNWVALTATIGTAIVATRAIINVVKDWVTEALTAQRVHSLLENSIKLQTSAYKAVTASLTAFAEAQAKVTKYGDEETKSVMTDLIALGVQYADIQRVTAAAMDLASARQISLSEAGSILARAYNGQTEMLRRYGIFIDTTGKKTQDFETVLGFVQKRMGGMAENEGKTLEGRLEIMNNRFKEIKETLGTKLLPVVIDTVTWWDKLLGRFEKFLNGGGTAMNPQLAALQTVRAQWNEILLVVKRYENEGGKVLNREQWGANVIKLKNSYLTLTDQEMRLFNIAVDTAKKKEFELNLNKQINTVKTQNGILDDEAKADLQAQLDADKKALAVEEDRTNQRRLNAQLVDIEAKQHEKQINDVLSSDRYSYEQKKALLQAYVDHAWITSFEANARLEALDAQRLAEWKKKNAESVAIMEGTYTALETAISDEFLKNVGQSLDKLNLNFANIFNSIRDAFYTMLLNMAAKAAAFGILDFITGGLFSRVSGGLKFEKGGYVKGYAQGGDIAGPSGTDTVPAMLTPGEFVVNKAATQMFRPMLEGINNMGRQRLATGGSVSNTSNKNVVINAPITLTGGVYMGGITEAKIAKELGDMLKRKGIRL